MRTVLIIFGGKSGEHEVSVKSALSIEKNIDKQKYQTLALGITHQGEWHLGNTISQITAHGKVLAPRMNVFLSQGDKDKSLAVTENSQTKKINFDLVFPIIHGTNGEDGTLQGMLELANLPYVGPGVLGSSASMDKIVQKQLCEVAKIPQTAYLFTTQNKWLKNKNVFIQKIKKNLSYPLFVKPANMGSSVGVNKVKTDQNLEKAINEAFKYDLKVIIEEEVADALEVEVSVLGNENPQASVCGSIKPNSEFYDYQTKYVTNDIKAEIPALIPENISQKIKDTAITTFKVMNCEGMARVDFLYQANNNKFYLNELNTLPGFTSISMYPKLWEKAGLNYKDLITRLLELAEERWQRKQQLSYNYQP